MSRDLRKLSYRTVWYPAVGPRGGTRMLRPLFETFLPELKFQCEFDFEFERHRQEEELSRDSTQRLSGKSWHKRPRLCILLKCEQARTLAPRKKCTFRIDSKPYRGIAPSARRISFSIHFSSPDRFGPRRGEGQSDRVVWMHPRDNENP
jgi:hypothetical protein